MSDAETREQLIELQCRYMDLEQVVSELDDQVQRLHQRVERAERERDALKRLLDRVADTHEERF